jgi:hypothetical protein
MLAWVAGAAFGLAPLGGRIGVAVAAAGVLAAAVRSIQVARRLRGEVLRGRVTPGPASSGPMSAARSGAASSGLTSAGRTEIGVSERREAARAEQAPPPGMISWLASSGPGSEATRDEGAGPARGPERAQTSTDDDVAPPGFHIFRPSPPDVGVADPRDGA